MKRLLTIAIVLLTTLLASAQNGTLNPTNPPEPSAKYKLTVTCQPAEAATTSGSGEYEQGKSVTVRATAKTNYKFKYWLKDGVQQSTTATSFSYTMTAADVKFVAVFEYVEPTPTPYDPSNPAEPQAQYRLTATAQPAEAATMSGGGNYTPGTSVNVRATAKANYKFLYWLKDGVKQSAVTTSITVTMPTAYVQYVAVFEYVEPEPTPYNPSNPSEPQGGSQTDVDNNPAILPGDLNDDKDVDGTDLVLLTNLILTGRTNTSGDLNSDGAVDGTDYVLMVNKILGITQ